MGASTCALPSLDGAWGGGLGRPFQRSGVGLMRLKELKQLLSDNALVSAMRKISNRNLSLKPDLNRWVLKKAAIVLTVWGLCWYNFRTTFLALGDDFGWFSLKKIQSRPTSSENHLLVNASKRGLFRLTPKRQGMRVCKYAERFKLAFSDITQTLEVEADQIEVREDLRGCRGGGKSRPVGVGWGV